MKPKIVSALPPSQPGAPRLKLPASVVRMGVLPAIVYPDSVLNLHHAGSLFSLILDDGYLDVPTTTTRFGRFQNGGPYTHIVVAAVVTVWDTTNTVVLAASQWECRLRRASDKYPIVESEWVPGDHVFGSGEYPNYLAMPLVLEAGDDLEIEVRNLSAVNMRIHPELRCRRKYRDAVNQEA